MLSFDDAVGISNIVSAIISAVTLFSSIGSAVVAYALRSKQTNATTTSLVENRVNPDHIVISKRLLKKSLILFAVSVAILLAGRALAGREADASGAANAQNPAAPQPVRLSVVGLAANPPSESAFFQVRVIVNGKAFTLPRNGDWMPAQSVIRNQSLVLPPLARYAIQFQVRKRDAYFANATPATLESNATVRYSGGEASGTYVLKGFDSTSPTGGSTISATVAYSLAPAR